ncbi:STAS domain-containing protein [Mycolicibacterium confluentis]
MTVARLGQLPACLVTATTPHRRLSIVGRRRADFSMITATGEIDTANARLFADHVMELAHGCSSVLLDLSGVTFLALDGMTALYAIRADLARTAVDWSLMPGPAVSRVLALCDPEGLVPTVDEAPERIAG